MKEYTISEGDAGIRLDKQLLKILSNAGSGFVYRMLRKKNITLNDKKATGNERLNKGDVIKIYLSDETFDRFSSGKGYDLKDISGVSRDIGDMILYEDDGLIILNKTPGLLSQKAASSDISINEMCLSYLVNRGELTQDKLKLFKPSVCNRLDRNTSGIIIFAKNHSMAASVGNALASRTIHKYYMCLVKGCIDKEDRVRSYLLKDENKNLVKIYEEDGPGRSLIETAYRPISYKDGVTLLEVDLITGKSHQIRAQMAALDHPLVGDVKYGDKSLNDLFKKKYSLKAQALHAYKLEIPGDIEGPLSYLAGRTFTAPPYGIMKEVINDIFDMYD